MRPDLPRHGPPRGAPRGGGAYLAVGGDGDGVHAAAGNVDDVGTVEARHGAKGRALVQIVRVLAELA